MKLLRYGSQGQEKPGLLAADGEIRDLSGIIPDLAGESLLPGSIVQADTDELPDASYTRTDSRTAGDSGQKGDVGVSHFFNRPGEQ